MTSPFVRKNNKKKIKGSMKSELEIKKQNKTSFKKKKKKKSAKTKFPRGGRHPAASLSLTICLLLKGMKEGEGSSAGMPLDPRRVR